jgi:hypothetical protein
VVASVQDNGGKRHCYESLDQRGDHSSVRSLLDLTAFNANTLEYFSASLFTDRKFTNDSIDDIFDRLGPIPRLCLDYQHTPQQLIRYRWDLSRAIAGATPDKINDLFMDASCLNMDSTSHKICLISREKQDEVDSDVVVALITPSIQSRLANQFRNSIPQNELLRHYQSTRQ